jgi:preprotein translocase subunit SecY
LFQVIKNAFSNPDLRKKLIYTIIIILIFRFGAAFLAPFVSTGGLSDVVAENSDSFFGILNAFSGGSFGNATVFAMSISPYITASIIIQLLTVAIPALERMAKEGAVGRKKLNKITRYTFVGMAFIQAVAYYIMLRNYGVIESGYTSGFAKYFAAVVIVLTLVAGAAITVWLADRISDKGFGNGTSIILFAGIIANLPNTMEVLAENFKAGGANYFTVPLGVLLLLAIVVLIVIMNNSERRIPIQYAKRVVGRKMYGGQSSYIPIKIAIGGVIPIIFAMSILAIPSTIAAFATPETGSFWYLVVRAFSTTGWIYCVCYFLMIIGFSYFYCAIEYNPIEIANNLKQNNGAIAGIRPGRSTAIFIQKILSKITFIGALFLAVIALFPPIYSACTNISLSLGGTSIIILVGVALDTMRQLESELTMRHYKGFLE